ncbi:NAD-dependent epimerase/dehydratase family protein [Nakamurella leprariae]|uniref:NAD-dependent epimerase/dehydratase family protein n=1 Tax=Nakamurella leprariae TaxID=2803911 RepID=A0A939BYR0_9ACTN|nr:NAD-dependent epimerase/dehydratase family protein [Nakamurella leprariae]MBM9467350.1 NAD-dependent epimerase/dehydratase family protein [Nakamurella leprariae]
MTDRHVVLGAGPVGTHLAQVLAARGHEVQVATRRATAVPMPTAAPAGGSITAVALDASDAEALTRLVDGATAFYNCINPAAYPQWERLWPPVHAALMTAAERTGTVLAVTGNLYPYGPVDRPMVEGMPDAATDHKGRLRARMWADLAQAHRAGRLRAVEVRGSDYVGPGVGPNGHVTRLLPALLRGRTGWAVDSADLPHSWTDVLDVARTLAAVADRPDTWGRIWHVPTNEPRTLRQAVTDVLAAAGRPPGRIRSVPDPIVAAIGRINPMMREVRELRYQRTRGYVLDSSLAQRELDLAPTPWERVCARTAGVTDAWTRERH